MAKNKDIDSLIQELSSRRADDRIMAIRTMQTCLVGRSVPKSLVKALRDKDELVRIEAAETLGIIGDRRSLPTLWKALKDSSDLVRRYAAIAIGSLGGKKDAAKLSRRCQKEVSPSARIGYFIARYLLREPNGMSGLLNLLDHKNYRVRCAAAHGLEYCSDNTADASIAIEALKGRLKRESTIAVKSSIYSSLRYLRQANC